MDTLLTIQERLRDIAKNSNISGPAVDGLVLLLSESIYRGQVGNITELLEGSFSRCRILNSAITHSLDRCYSVYRGRNQMFELTNIVPIESFSVKKYDTAIEAGGYKLVYADNYQFTTMVDPGKIYLILTTGTISKTSEVSTIDTVRINFLYKNISESISVFRDNLTGYENAGNIHYTEVLSTRDFGESVRGVEAYDDELEAFTFCNPLWIGTRENYSVSIVNTSNNSFVPGERIMIKYLEYLDQDIKIEDIPSLPGFVSTLNNIDNNGEVLSQDNQITYSNYKSIPHIPRTTSISEIFKEANKSYLTTGVIKSFTDIESLITQKYGELIESISVRFDFTSNLTKIGNIGGKTTPYILVYYADKYPDNTLDNNIIDENKEKLIIDDNNTNIVAFKIKDFTSELKKAYYIDEEIYFIQPTKLSIPRASDLDKYVPLEGNNSWLDADSGKIKLKIYYTGLEYPSKGIKEVCDLYNCTFYKKLNLSRLVADLQDVDGVKFVELFVENKNLPNGEAEFPSITIEIPEDSVVTGEDKDGNSVSFINKKIQNTVFSYEFISYEDYIKNN